MAGDWDVVSLESLIEPGRTISYGIVQPGPAVNDGVPIVRVGDVRGQRIAVDAPHRVAPQIEAAHSRTRLRGGELLMTLVGTVGEMAIAPAELADWNTARAVAVIPLRADVGAYWASVALNLPEVRAIIDSRVNTTVQTTLNLRDVAQLPVVMPPRHERDRIAHILGTLDDKIELNRRMSHTLEQMARALFKSWFVDFEPVRTKAEGRDTGLPKHLADLFPDRLVDSELGEIPQGWPIRRLDDDFVLTMGQSPPGDTYNSDGDGLPFYQGRSDFGVRFPSLRMYCTAPTRLAAEGDTLVSVRAPVGDANLATEPCAIGRGVAAIRHKSGAIEFTIQQMRNLAPKFDSFNSEGTVFGSISKKDFHAITFVAAPLDLVTVFETTFAPVTARLYSTRGSTRDLTSTRDLLLAKLLAGGSKLTEVSPK